MARPRKKKITTTIQIDRDHRRAAEEVADVVFRDHRTTRQFSAVVNHCLRRVWETLYPDRTWPPEPRRSAIG